MAFSEVKYTVTFTESGLPSGSTWYVNLSNGQTLSSTTDTISFSEPNETYIYTIATSNHVFTPSTILEFLTVNGKNVTQSITFSSVPSTTPTPKEPSPPSSSNTDLYIIIGAVAAVAVVEAGVMIMMRRRK